MDILKITVDFKYSLVYVIRHDEPAQKKNILCYFLLKICVDCSIKGSILNNIKLLTIIQVNKIQHGIKFIKNVLLGNENLIRFESYFNLE
ncbi:hypothetical protein HZS_3540 [Henneguya salminicola]|nr:hypothetical protein HZS_3540 [Henneguya salminicola]